MLVDANILLYAVDRNSRFHESASTWLTDALNGNERVGLPWQSLIAFLRIATHPRASAQPLQPDEAWQVVDDWLSADLAWVPVPTARHRFILHHLVATHQLAANLIPDAHLAALAIEHGVEVCSGDSDFARFPDVRWSNPLR